MRAISPRNRIQLPLVVIFSVSVSFAQSFRQDTYHTPNRPSDVFIADLNHDGHPDIVTTQSTSNMVTVFLNHGNGTFTDGGSATYLVGGSFPQRILVADFNQDGNPDIATGTCDLSQPNFLSILFGNGDGTFQPHVDYRIPGGCALGLGTIRVAHDTAPSLIVGIGWPGVQLFRNDGTGTFHLQIIPTTGNMVGVSAADYNHDGIADIAAIEYTTIAQLVVFYGDASGGFGAAQTVQTSNPPNFLETNTVDFTGDGVGDLLVPWEFDLQSGVTAFANNGFGKFTSTTLTLAPGYILPGFRAAEGDFTRGGFHGIVLPVSGTGTEVPDAVAYFPAHGKGVWSPPVYLPLRANSDPHSASVADFNHDGLLDFAMVTSADDTLHVFINDSCPLPTKAGIAVCSPVRGSTVGSPVRISATAKGGTRPIVAMKAYIGGKQVASSGNNMLNASVVQISGKHTLTINAWDSAGKLYQAIETFAVTGPKSF